MGLNTDAAGVYMAQAGFDARSSRCATTILIRTEIRSTDYFFLCRFFLRRFLRLWVAILWRFRFFPLGMTNGVLWVE